MSKVKTPNNFELDPDRDSPLIEDLGMLICRYICKKKMSAFECEHYMEDCSPEDAIHPDTIKALKKRGDHE